MKERVAILGCGGFAREVLWLLRQGRVHGTGARLEPAGFIDRCSDPAGFRGLPVWSLNEAPKDLRFVCGIGGMPEIKQRACDEAESAGLRPAPPVVFDGLAIGPEVELGEGTVVCAGNILTCDIRVGRHVAINLDCTVGHDSVLGDYSTLSPGTHVSGRVTLGRGAYCGTGCSIIEGIDVGAFAVIGAGAVVTRPVPPESLVVGVPAVVRKAPRDFAIPRSPEKAPSLESVR